MCGYWEYVTEKRLVVKAQMREREREKERERRQNERHIEIVGESGREKKRQWKGKKETVVKKLRERERKDRKKRREL